MDVNISIYRDTTHDGEQGLVWEADDAEGFLTEMDLSDIESMSEFKVLLHELYSAATEDDDFEDIVLEIDSDTESELPFEVEQSFEDNGWGDLDR